MWKMHNRYIYIGVDIIGGRDTTDTFIVGLITLVEGSQHIHL